LHYQKIERVLFPCACGRFIHFSHYVSGEVVRTSPPSSLHSIAFSSFHPPQHRTANNGVAFREPKSISSFIAGFKSAVTVRINTLRQTKGQAVWQTRFHDHVIRDYEECRRIGAYIDMNIANWNEDRYYVQ